MKFYFANYRYFIILPHLIRPMFHSCEQKGLRRCFVEDQVNYELLYWNKFKFVNYSIAMWLDLAIHQQNTLMVLPKALLTQKRSKIDFAFLPPPYLAAS